MCGGWLTASKKYQLPALGVQVFGPFIRPVWRAPDRRKGEPHRELLPVVAGVRPGRPDDERPAGPADQ